MDITVRATNLDLTDAIEAFVREKLAAALGKFTHGIRAVFVRISDLNGPKGGDDMRCHVTVEFTSRETGVEVEHRAGDLYIGIAEAAKRTKQAVTRRLGEKSPLRDGGRKS